MLLIISYLSFGVMHNCAPNSNECMGPSLADYDCFATFNMRTIIFGISGVNVGDILELMRKIPSANQPIINKGYTIGSVSDL